MSQADAENSGKGSERRGIGTPMVGKGAPLPLRLRFAHHNHDGKIAFATWSSGGLEMKSNESRICFIFSVGWVAPHSLRNVQPSVHHIALSLYRFASRLHMNVLYLFIPIDKEIKIYMRTAQGFLLRSA